ncbi:hypothetical protein A3D05_00125 [Candidatus Gottesmanbacteria bacterium RIFCSPHIGHO2_02_FULL_40_24]|uniref:Sortase n=1 Tax=Candidatus Gottesmanbacteria bacterium RIFCSPHIGHO2_01_FULL_40_15 TaxID=1798376 RepID=A0A1F5Z6L2_9BACT|nr:MAG: hypothetical protein A2777_00130 [Candidatus Gottesmanbacteria bacterium RIFCSPHIGHO2_01_FULL_40_15]OGG17759.1 MAG: hypothetical protein A3D05_00125 [Candidatus Gottesmanbacteria bacterium RIFCSPHIGHO2_02_FULL_40_24]OGG25503.1 MAG: hypothetical protein A3E42_03595 [Candidatus Gottesmanbacteria bacterium RIFCSPHIGHO2_12_FULL_40_13]OGG33161.1 MAG: hypothetical protein A3I80_01605 [Candidatus Gottesmanbacteria bacterium RIFCSPLOWO2_02_FULL_40_10]
MKINREKIKFIILRTIGNFLVLASLFGIFRTLGPALYIETKYRVNQLRNVRYELTFRPAKAEPASPPTAPEKLTPTPNIQEAQSTFFGQISGGDKVEFISPVSTEFGLVIPKIGANAPVFPNINAADKKEYLPVLRQGVAHAMGSVFPGVTGNIYLFAHSTDNFWNVGRYNAIFYLLKELEKGDEVNLIFQGKRHIYRVVNKMIVSPTDVSYLTQQTNYEQLTLQTCWPPGTTFKRLIVIARPEKDLNLNEITAEKNSDFTDFSSL